MNLVKGIAVTDCQCVAKVSCGTHFSAVNVAHGVEMSGSSQASPFTSRRFLREKVVARQ